MFVDKNTRIEIWSQTNTIKISQIHSKTCSFSPSYSLMPCNYNRMPSLSQTNTTLCESSTLFHHVSGLFVSDLPRSVAGSVASLLPRAAVNRKSPLAGVTAVRLPHTFLIQKTNLQGSKESSSGSPLQGGCSSGVEPRLVIRRSLVRFRAARYIVWASPLSIDVRVCNSHIAEPAM